MTPGRENSRPSSSGRRTALAGTVALAASLTLPVFATTALAAPPSPPFTQCPAIGANTSCETLIVINSDGTVTIVSDPGQGPYDGSEDTLIGVQNNESAAVASIQLSSSTLRIFGFERDGICAFAPFTGSGYCTSLPRGSYEGPDTTFSGISVNKRSGTVNFTDSGGGLPAGAGTFFSLEQNVRANNLAATPPPLVTFTNSSPTTADFNDPTTVSATLTASGVPVSGATVTFKIESGAGGATCSGTSDGSGVASCSITPNEAAGTYQISASSAAASNASEAFTVTHEQDTLAYTGPASATNGKPVTLSGNLTTDDPSAGTVLAGKTVTLTLGSGAASQSCSGTTNASGVASCTIPSVSQTVGPAQVAATFAGDTFYLVATASGNLTISGISVPAVGDASLPGPPGGLALLAAGGGLVALGRRRRRHEVKQT